jgi:small conductance mechanosensitive channel
LGITIFGVDIEAPLPLIGVSIFNIIMFIVVLIVGIIVIRLAARALKKSMLRAHLSELLSEFLTRVVRIMLYVFLIFIALGFLGIHIGEALIALSVVFGFVLGFAFGDTLSNMAAGFMIALTRPFKVGDYVSVAGESGTIRSVGISLTELVTPDNKHVVVPNKLVWGSHIVNYTRLPIRRVDMSVGVGYNDNLDEVLKTIMKIVKDHPKVLEDPAPQVALNELGDSAVVFVVRPWTKTEDYWGVYFGLQKKIKEGLDEAGISIPYPQMDVHMKQKK